MTLIAVHRTKDDSSQMLWKLPYEFFQDGVIDPALKAFEDNRQTFIEIMREIRKKNPNIDPVELQKQAEYEMISRGPKSRAFYRLVGILLCRRLKKARSYCIHWTLSKNIRIFKKDSPLSVDSER